MSASSVGNSVESRDRLGDLEQRVGRLASRREVYEGQIREVRTELEDQKGYLDVATKGRALVQAVAAEVQQNIVGLVTSLVTEALRIFPEPYTFGLEFVERRRRTEADMWLERQGLRVHPLDAAGGGVADIVAFALRLVVWAITRPRGLFILDEPFRNLSAGYHEAAGELLSSMAKRLGIQLVVITHLQGIVDRADRVFDLESHKVSVADVPEQEVKVPVSLVRIPASRARAIGVMEEPHE